MNKKRLFKKEHRKALQYYGKPFKKLPFVPEERLKVFHKVLEFVDANYLYAGDMLDVTSRMFKLPKDRINRYSRAFLQTNFFDYVACKKLDYAAEMLLTKQKWDFISVLNLSGWIGFAPYQHFASCFFSRYGYTWYRWANLGRVFEDTWDGSGRAILAQQWADKYHKELMEAFHAHKTAWWEIWNLPDEEKRRYRLSYCFSNTSRIHTSGNWKRRGVNAASKKNFKLYLSNEPVRKTPVSDGSVFLPKKKRKDGNVVYGRLRMGEGVRWRDFSYCQRQATGPGEMLRSDDPHAPADENKESGSV